MQKNKTTWILPLYPDPHQKLMRSRKSSSIVSLGMRLTNQLPLHKLELLRTRSYLVGKGKKGMKMLGSIEGYERES